ncbi:hypothetical protein B0J14DRAFT_653509 [Halenospora varia]|nr:hypothetical protein B0J14DRAFT_653509 [Halenospora varia]
MTKTRNPHRTLSSWKRDITLLTCILQVRIQPAIPFSAIAECLLSTWPTPMLKIGERRMSKESRAEYVASGQLLEWLTKFLQLRFEQAESSSSELWTLAKECEKEIVEDMLTVTEFRDTGCELLTMDEMLLQVKWRKAGDWRAGSTLLGRSESIEEMCNFSREIGSRPASRCGNRPDTSNPPTTNDQPLDSISGNVTKGARSFAQVVNPSASIIWPIQRFPYGIQKAADSLSDFDDLPTTYKSNISTNADGWKRTLRMLRELQKDNISRMEKLRVAVTAEASCDPFAEQNEKIKLMKKISGLEPSESPDTTIHNLYSDYLYSSYIYSAYTNPGNFEWVEVQM